MGFCPKMISRLKSLKVKTKTVDRPRIKAMAKKAQPLQFLMNEIGRYESMIRPYRSKAETLLEQCPSARIDRLFKFSCGSKFEDAVDLMKKSTLEGAFGLVKKSALEDVVNKDLKHQTELDRMFGHRELRNLGYGVYPY